jgi:hypothetical protein
MLTASTDVYFIFSNEKAEIEGINCWCVGKLTDFAEVRRAQLILPDLGKLLDKLSEHKAVGHRFASPRGCIVHMGLDGLGIGRVLHLEQSQSMIVSFGLSQARTLL